MKLAYITAHDVSDVAAWSGIVYHLFEALARQTEVVPIMTPLAAPNPLQRQFERLRLKTTGKKYMRQLSPAYLKALSQEARAATERAGVDAALALGQGTLSNWTGSIPASFFSDTLYGAKFDFYSTWIRARMTQQQVTELAWLGQQAIDRSRRVFVTSSFAFDKAKQELGTVCPPEKTVVTRIGANWDAKYTGLVTRPPPPPLKLLWVGVDWGRKGGVDAVGVLERLQGHGLETELHIVGCDPGLRQPGVHIHGRLRKWIPDEMERLIDLYRQAHLFIFPTRADMSSVVLAEAASTGLPGVTVPIGGLGDLFEADEAIYLNPKTFQDEAVPVILNLLQTNGLDELGRKAYRRYQTHLNWDTIAAHMLREIETSLR
jgi:glycosyltransferase involved in cell wall biosynthesis